LRRNRRGFVGGRKKPDGPAALRPSVDSLTPRAYIPRAMKIISLNVGRPRLAVWNGQPISTGIYKSPVGERVMLRTLNLDGDRQADLSVHGGPLKAAYAYPSEHYDYSRG